MAATARRVPWLRIGAEAVAIVGSILLAFSIDAWNERRLERALEAEYLERISDELSDAKAVLESILLSADGNRLSAPDLTEFFDGRMTTGDHQRLVFAIYAFGGNPLLRFDVSTFDDLVSTGRLGLIADPELRQAVQRAYAGLQRLTPLLDPYRDEYMAALYGWLPTSVRQQLRAACPEYSSYAACSDLHLDDEAVRLIVERINTPEALLVFQTRELRLGTLSGIGRGTMVVLDEALTRLERSPPLAASRR
jgi:hypothetical protein